MDLFARIEWLNSCSNVRIRLHSKSMQKRCVEVYKRIHQFWSTKDRPIDLPNAAQREMRMIKSKCLVPFAHSTLFRHFTLLKFLTLYNSTETNHTYCISNMSSISEYEDPMSYPGNILNIIERALSQVRGTLQELERALSGVDQTLNIVGVDITTFRSPLHTFVSPRYDELQITDDDFLGELFEDDGETMKDEFVNALKEAKYDSDISMPDSLLEEELDLPGDLEEAVSSLGYPENADERIAEMTREMEKNADNKGQRIAETKREVWGGPGDGGVSIGQTTTTTESSEGYIYN
jgi:hypothetical protein